MSSKVEKTKNANEIKIEIKIDAEKFDNAIKKVYFQSAKYFNIPGFRKGKAPRKIIENNYGKGVFYEDAANDIMPKAYADALDETGIDVVSRPEIDVTKIGKGESFIFTATVAIKPEVTLGQYKGLEVQKESVEVTDEEVEAELKKAQEQNAREITVEDRPVKEGDVITLDYAGTIAGVPFDGGTATSQKLEIGSHSFIDTFEDQLVGLNIGDEKDVEVTFPEEYHAPDLAGKPASFHVKVLGITEKQLPEIDDDFAQDTTEFDSLEEYKADVRAKLEQSKEERAKSEMENVLVEKAVEGATMDIPDAMIDSQVEQMIDEFKQRVTYQGISFEQYLQFTGQNPEAFQESMRPEAVKRIQSSLVLEAIVAAENIEATDEDLNKEMEKMASMYQMDVEQIASFIQDEQKENMKKDIAIQKAVEFLAAEAKVTEASDELDFEAE